ncbi:hypothetical protein [Methanolobus vulcani]|uniref:Uncharacterized protein n=1 Tax=Methanolobus vulcani TaxID=38026 RepID=A0A7Z8KP63_9EURY|nr:hypothetical protein [Methanolobus vulcani]TQD23480.1 hypothetical protein FKV42_13215 [Methanolobus vulcani]
MSDVSSVVVANYNFTTFPGSSLISKSIRNDDIPGLGEVWIYGLKGSLKRYVPHLKTDSYQW